MNPLFSFDTSVNYRKGTILFVAIKNYELIIS